MLATSTEEAVCEQILALLADYKDPSVPLPSTRKLGQMLDLSHVTVSKALRLMSDRGELWRSDNGRYYPKTARLIFDAPKPVTCFLRSINAWAGWYPQIMQGIGLACEQADSGLLIHPVSSLFDQDAAHTAPRVASHAEQRELMESLLLRTQADGSRLILDDLWRDSVLAEFADRLAGARLLLRPSTVPQLHSVTPDFNQGALLALSHLLGRGYDKIWVVRPFADVVTIDTVVEAFEEAFANAGADASRFEVIDNAASLGAEALVARLKAQKGRVGIYCAEDNFALALFRSLSAAGIPVPQKAGLIAGWGTGAVATLGLTSLRVDLQRLGAVAVSAEDSALHPFRPVVDFSLYSGSST